MKQRALLTTVARDFREDDWWGFAGAENFPNGDTPIIREAETKDWGVLLVADANGISIYFYREEDEHIFSWNVPLPSAFVARFIVDGIQNFDKQSLVEAGFEEW